MKKHPSVFLSALLTGCLALSLAAGCQSNSSTSQPASSAAPVSSAALASSAVSQGAESGAGAQDGGSVVVGFQTEPDHFDPYKTETADTRSLLFNIFEGLVKPDTEGNLVPAVAQDLPEISPDGLTYTFKIRNGIKFHNGKAVTAEDVKYSLETAKAAKISTAANIKSVEAADPSTVKLTLEQRDNDFLANLTIAIVPKDYADQDAHPIGTGPFKFESFTQQQSVVLVKNPDYWQKGLPHLDKVTFKLESDTNALLLDLKSGSVDVASVANAAAQQLTSGFTIEQSNSNAVQQLDLNNSFKPFSNVKVRQAVSYAVDPDEIIQTATFGKGVRVGTPVIPGFKKYYDESLAKAYPKDLAKAKQLLAEAGYPNGFSFAISVPSNYQVHVDTAQVIVNQLKQIGVTATIKQVDWATWISKVYTGREYEATIISVDGAVLTPASFLSRYVSTAKNNFFNYKDPEFDKLYEQAANENDDAKRAELFKQAQRLISKDAANVYIQDIASLTALKTGIKGFTAYPLYVFDASPLYRSK